MLSFLVTLWLAQAPAALDAEVLQAVKHERGVTLDLLKVYCELWKKHGQAKLSASLSRVWAKLTPASEARTMLPLWLESQKPDVEWVGQLIQARETISAQGACPQKLAEKPPVK